jgi:hypothetical protein
MATCASAKRKRGSAPVLPPSDGRLARRALGGSGGGGGASAAAAAEQGKEPPTLVEVESDVPWAIAMKTAREAGEFLDVTLVADGREIEAHKLVITSLSPYLHGLLTSGLAESASQSQKLTLQEMDGRALEAVVDCMYSGKLAVSPHSVTRIIRVANLLQVGPVEKAAGEFFVSKLEPSTAADALGFAAERVECGEHAKALHAKSIEYAIDHFAAASREASFLSLSCDTIASLIASDELPVSEPDVVSAVRSWFQHDAAGRKQSLKTLMQLVRWPQMSAKGRRGLSDEVLFKQLLTVDNDSRKLGMDLLLECFDPELREAACPRLKRRKGAPQRLPTLSWVAGTGYRTRERGALLETTSDNARWRAARCGAHVMNSGQHCADFTVVRGPNDACVNIGVVDPTVSLDVSRVHNSSKFRGIYDGDGGSVGELGHCEWDETQGALIFEGDVMRLLLDCDAGTVMVKINGVLCGTLASGLTGDLCWAVCMGVDDEEQDDEDDEEEGAAAVRITAVDPQDF